MSMDQEARRQGQDGSVPDWVRGVNKDQAGSPPEIPLRRSLMNFGKLRGTYFTRDKDFAKYMAQGGSQKVGDLIGDLRGKVKKLNISKDLFKKLGASDFEVNIKDPKLLKAAKTDVLQTIMARAGSFTPLAMKGLQFITSLPVATATMVLQSTPANADEANMQLEDFAKLAEANNLNMGSNMDKALPGGNKDI